MAHGPQTTYADTIHAEKYRLPGETFRDAMNRVASALKDSDAHYHEFRDALLDMRFMPAGRIQAAMGSPKAVTPYNCYVSGSIPDSFVDRENDQQSSIMHRAEQAASTMRMGGGIGYDFSTLRPAGALIQKLQSRSSGPLGFMPIFNEICKATSSAGNRRGAQMGVLRIDHPDIHAFIAAKHNSTALTGFNVSVAVTDEFMDALAAKRPFDLRFGGQVYSTVDPVELWESLMRSTWEWAEPGVLFIDRINAMNNLWYAEKIAATNPSMPAGTLIHTSEGIAPIESFEGKKFQVKSLDGQWADAECFLSSESADVIEIDFGGGRTVQCTPEHRWPVLLNGRYVKVDAGDLTIGDFIPANRNEPLGHEVDPSLTYEDGLMAGLAFGDGSYGIRKDDGRAYLSFHNNIRDCELAERQAAYFGANICPQSDEIVVNVTQDAKVRYFAEKVGLTFGDKSSLPTKVWASNDNFVAGFVDGIFSSDGNVDAKSKRISVCNKDEKVIREIGWLLSFHGILGSYWTTEVKQNGKTYYRTDLAIPHNGAKRFSNVFKLTCEHKANLLKELVQTDCRQHISADHLEVKAIRRVGKARVWDVSVYHPQHVFPTIWGTTGNCGEQPLPPFGACLLGSFNLVRYLSQQPGGWHFDWEQLRADIPAVVRAMDNVVDRAIYPLPEQRQEALNKRRMGLGVTGLANAAEAMGMPYGGQAFLAFEDALLLFITHYVYWASVELAKEKGAFPLFDADRYCAGNFIKTLDSDLQAAIRKYGIRNSHLTSIAPTGTISLAADNVSSSIEPVYRWHQERTVLMDSGRQTIDLYDYGFANLQVRGKRTSMGEVTAREHVDVLTTAQQHIDSAVSKTVNVTGDMPWDDFKGIYLSAYEAGAKGCTTFNKDGKRAGLFRETPEPADLPFPAERRDGAGVAEAGLSCEFDPATGRRSCE